MSASMLGGVSGVEQIRLAAGTNNITLTDGVVGSAAGRLLTVMGGTGNDRVDASAVVTAANGVIFSLGLGNDTAIGGAGADQFRFTSAGLTGADLVAGGGGAAFDILSFTSPGTVAASAFANVSGVERLILSGSGGNNVSLADAMVGSANNNLLTVIGGAGNDRINASAVTAPENRINILAGTGNDTLTGGNGADRLTGGAGVDSVSGGIGPDTLIIEAASEIGAGEVLAGGAGDDTLAGDDFTGAVDLTSATLTGLESIADFTGLTLTAAQLDAFTGSIIGTGAITISGSGAVDLTDADLGNTTFNLSDAGNSLSFGARSFSFYRVNGGAADDTVTMISSGVSGHELNGRGGDDTLTGGANTGPNPDEGDTITGGAGSDRMTGGGGTSSDRFVFNGSSSPTDVDSITDFSPSSGAEQGDFLVFEGVLQGGFEYKGAAAFDANGNTQARVSGNRVQVDADGDGSADILIDLQSAAAQLQSSQFLFV